MLETVDAVTAAVGRDRVGVRVSPFGRYNGMHPFDDESETWLAAAAELSARRLAYLHISDQTTMGQESIPADFLDKFRKAYDGTMILAGGFLKENGQAALDSGSADLIAIGRPFIANPDLVDRLRNDLPLAEADRATFYEGGKKGYIDYPATGIGAGSA
jgi:N-ethylmaleimide reductase